MSLPSGYRTDMCQPIKCTVEEHKVYTNSTGADKLQGDFVVLDDIVCGVADRDAVDGAYISLNVSDKLEILTTNVAAASTFDAQGTVVFWDDTNQEFTDISASGLFEVGFILEAKDANDLIRFQMYNVVKEVVA